MSSKAILYQYWEKLYPDQSTHALDQFLQGLTPVETDLGEDDWYKDAIVYALYVDLFNKDFHGLIDQLDYLERLGVNCLWLLPILDSPMRDAGFDIRNYDQVRIDLLGLDDTASKQEQDEVFAYFLKEAHGRGIRVIFDIAINHVSDQHPWFQDALTSENSTYRDYFIWSKDTSLYGDARLLFKGIEPSNWEAAGDWHYFHRFFSFQPDLNYRNPNVLLAMSSYLLYWQSLGVDGFRADAIPYLWKEEGTSCENLDNTHVIVKFFRAILDYVNPGSLLLAEACQKPAEVVKYMGDGDECHAAYHFPLMPMMFKSIATGNAEPIMKTLSAKHSPQIPENSQWLTFLRVHDELSLELVYVSEDDRKLIHDHYCHKPDWDFRIGEGISARLSELMERDPKKISLAYSLMLTLTGTPVVYYGDEFGKLNDEKYYKEQIELTGKDDTRFLVRGRIYWDQLSKNLDDPQNFHSRLLATTTTMLNTRKQHKAFGRGSTEFLDLQDDTGAPTSELIAYVREYGGETLLIINNLTDKTKAIKRPLANKDFMLLFEQGFSVNDHDETLVFEAHGIAWLRLIRKN